MTELTKYKEVIFHFNTGHLKDSSIPMWVLKMKGKAHYVEHVNAQAPWSTKETPNNATTKGSLKFKNVHVVINDGIATITEAT